MICDTAYTAKQFIEARQCRNGALREVYLAPRVSRRETAPAGVEGIATTVLVTFIVELQQNLRDYSGYNAKLQPAGKLCAGAAAVLRWQPWSRDTANEHDGKFFSGRETGQAQTSLDGYINACLARMLV